MVSSFKDYLSCRPTEVAEEDVLLCESRYIESEKQMKKFKGLKRFSLSAKVVDDEVYYFRWASLYRRRRANIKMWMSLVMLIIPPLLLVHF